jgi:hypothetical protein
VATVGPRRLSEHQTRPPHELQFESNNRILAMQPMYQTGAAKIPCWFRLSNHPDAVAKIHLVPGKMMQAEGTEVGKLFRGRRRSGRVMRVATDLPGWVEHLPHDDPAKR